MDPIGFVRAARPFGDLTERELAHLVGALEVVYVPRGDRVADRVASSQYVYLVRKGAVRVEKDGTTAHLEEAEVFGGPDGTFCAPLEAWAEEDSLLYRWPAHVVEAVRQRGAVEGEVRSGVLVPVEQLVRRAPVWVPLDATCQQAAQRMAQEGVSSVLVVRQPPAGEGLPVSALAGILTDRDLRIKVVARGLGGDVPVAHVMSSPVHTVDSTTATFSAVLRMLELGVHHLPVVRDGFVVGMVTDTDLVRLQAHSPLFLLKRLEAGEVGRYAEEVAQTAGALLGAGVDVAQVCRAVTQLHDALCRRVVADAHARVGPAPVPYAWVVCGSEGREEQVLPTDQDNFLVTAQDGHEAFFAAFAEAVAEGLQAAGFPPCPGGYMATRWCLPLRRWAEEFHRWLSDPQGESLLHLQVFLDFRRVAGTLSLEPLEQVVQSARHAPVALAHMARSCVGFPVPLGPFRGLRSRHGKVDLKGGLVAPLVCVARVMALAAGSRARNTFERLQAAAQAGLVSREDAEAASDALGFGLRLRLQSQLRAVREGRRPDNEVAVAELSGWEVRRLRESLWAARQLQEVLRRRYHLYLWG
ncbi:MAG: DUF294 nucleotidyltransferase-like domain-containing protein [Armatimonadota bacterium]|nr:DUF294 nucleotidyltransferase-like domain-containing protein [Armatimonadota bacterium]MDW8155859.1 DUF294 nucleotidyltransferase-like domain-containing protein [Armatimonadota bacterium]